LWQATSSSTCWKSTCALPLLRRMAWWRRCSEPPRCCWPAAGHSDGVEELAAQLERALPASPRVAAECIRCVRACVRARVRVRVRLRRLYAPLSRFYIFVVFSRLQIPARVPKRHCEPRGDLRQPRGGGSGSGRHQAYAGSEGAFRVRQTSASPPPPPPPPPSSSSSLRPPPPLPPPTSERASGRVSACRAPALPRCGQCRGVAL
jgi:hypothetical protein